MAYCWCWDEDTQRGLPTMHVDLIRRRGRSELENPRVCMVPCASVKNRSSSSS